MELYQPILVTKAQTNLLCTSSVVKLFWTSNQKVISLRVFKSDFFFWAACDTDKKNIFRNVTSLYLFQLLVWLPCSMILTLFYVSKFHFTKLTVKRWTLKQKYFHKTEELLFAL